MCLPGQVTQDTDCTWTADLAEGRDRRLPDVRVILEGQLGEVGHVIGRPNRTQRPGGLKSYLGIFADECGSDDGSPPTLERSTHRHQRAGLESRVAVLIGIEDRFGAYGRFA